METRLKQLLGAGQSVRLDNLSRALLTSGDLRRMIEQGVRGVTSNPTIFRNAIAHAHDYDDEIRSLGTNVSNRQRLNAGERIGTVASANSLLISRIDTAVDRLLDQRITQGQPLAHLRGAAGIAAVKTAYRRYRDIFCGADFAVLTERSERPQRPLWANDAAGYPRRVARPWDHRTRHRNEKQQMFAALQPRKRA